MGAQTGGQRGCDDGREKGNARKPEAGTVTLLDDDGFSLPPGDAHRAVKRLYIYTGQGINALQLRGQSRSCLTVLTSLDPVYQGHIMVFQAFLKEF